jgi:hypothetical protein
MGSLKIGIDLQCLQSNSLGRGIGKYVMSFTKKLVSILDRKDTLVIFTDPLFSKVDIPLRFNEITDTRIVHTSIPKIYQSEFLSQRLSNYASAKSSMMYSKLVRASVDVFLNPSLYEGIDYKFTYYTPSKDVNFDDYAIIYDYTRNTMPIEVKGYKFRKTSIDNTLKNYKNLLNISDAIHNQGLRDIENRLRSRVIFFDFLD